MDIVNIFTFLKQAWDLLDGNKTKIGAALLLVAATGTQVEGIFEIHPAFLDGIISWCTLWGGKIGVIGLAHKGLKAIPQGTN